MGWIKIEEAKISTDYRPGDIVEVLNGNLVGQKFYVASIDEQFNEGVWVAVKYDEDKVWINKMDFTEIILYKRF